MRLTKDQVKHVAKLANLPLTEDEEERYSEQLSKILKYVDQLNQVNTSKIEPTFNVSDQNTVEREDITSPSLSQEDALLNAPKRQNGMFETKGVFEE